MVAAVNPIAQACYFSGFEYYKVFEGYGQTIGNPDELTYNVVHNMGHIYDALTDMIAVLRYGDPTQRSYWYRIGMDVGVMVNMISYVPSNYNPYVGPIPNPPTPASPSSPSTNHTTPSNHTLAAF